MWTFFLEQCSYPQLAGVDACSPLFFSHIKHVTSSSYRELLLTVNIFSKSVVLLNVLCILGCIACTTSIMQSCDQRSQVCPSVCHATAAWIEVVTGEVSWRPKAHYIRWGYDPPNSKDRLGATYAKLLANLASFWQCICTGKINFIKKR